MAKLVAVDPGIRACGVAYFTDGRLESAELVQNPCETGNRADEAAAMARRIWVSGSDVVAVEWPQTYRGRAARGDTNDLFALASIGGALSALAGIRAVTSYLPAEWKGNMKKGPCHERIRKRLSTEELEVLAAVECPKLKLHNVLDAIGIGLHHLGRLGIRR